MVTIDQLTKNQHSQVQSLDLSSSRSDKIYRIQCLERFVNLRCLNLANNMIVRLQNITCLVNLRILNVEFNQISRLEEIKTLNKLEELFISYNCIEQISPDIKYNQRLRVLHIAYNDIKTLEDIRSLSTLPSLSILSLMGNPFLAALNYIAFVKMLIPSLLMLDDRDASQSLIAANVYPHEQIFILRDALNKLLDERNMNSHYMVDSGMPSQTPGRSQKEKLKQQNNSPIGGSASKQFKKSNGEKVNILQHIQEWIESNQKKIQIKKKQISKLSDKYTIKSQEKQIWSKGKKRGTRQLQDIINRYQIQEEQGLLNPQKKQKLIRLIKQFQQMQNIDEENREQSRQLLQNLKNKQLQYNQLKQKLQLLKNLRIKIQSSEDDPHKAILNHIFFGPTFEHELKLKDIKKFILQPEGLMKLYEMQSYIIFGQLADNQRIIKLKNFLGEKSLIQIINNLKQMGLKHKKQRKKYEKERSKIIQKFQTEAQQLCQQWKQLQKEKYMLYNSRQFSQIQIKTKTEDRFARVEEEERNKILILRQQKQHYQQKIQQLQKKHEDLQLDFDRKYQELEQFQKFFQQFKNEKQIVTDMKEQIKQTRKQVQNNNAMLAQVSQTVKEMTLKQELLHQKIIHYERKCFEKAEQLSLYDDKLKNIVQKVKKINEQYNLKNYEIVKMQQSITKLIEDNRDYEKRVERNRTSLDIFQQKLKNLSQLEYNKKSILSGLEAQIQYEKKRLNEVLQKVAQVQQKLNRSMQTSYQYQMKIQQGKKNVESLSDINKTLTDMIQRQSQLKRSIMELQLENQHLLQMKNKLVRDLKECYDDQDENL